MLRSFSVTLLLLGGGLGTGCGGADETSSVPMDTAVSLPDTPETDTAIDTQDEDAGEDTSTSDGGLSDVEEDTSIDADSVQEPDTNAGEPQDTDEPPEDADSETPDDGPDPTDDGPDPTDEGPELPDDGPVSGCGEVTEGGNCDGDLWVHCVDEQVETVDCAASEQQCLYDEATESASCVDVSPSCESHAECLDADFCTKDLCDDGVCVHEVANCDDSSDCTEDVCNELVGCVYQFEGGAGCTPYTGLFWADFDDGTVQDMAIADLAQNVEGGDPVIWHPDPTLTFAGAGALYFGSPLTYDYDNGKVVAASATTPELALPADQQLELSFQMWMDVEEGGDWDVLTVTVKTPQKSVPVWAKNADNVTLQTWQEVTVDLTAFAGETVALAITFNSTDPTFNSTRGVVIDSVQVRALLSPKGCASASDCDDQIACTEETCTEGFCSYTVSDSCCVTAADCFDADACTIDLCTAGQCEQVPVAEPNCCNVDSDCTDASACTEDVCEVNNLCSNVVDLTIPGCCVTAAHCNDGDTCTIDSCQDTLCTYINTCCQSDDECDDGDDVCTVDTCDAGACKYSYLNVAGCCTPVVFQEDFEEGIDNWTTISSNSTCKWGLVSNGKAVSTPSSAYYGNPSTKNYDCSVQHSGTLTSADVTIPDKPGLSLEFDIWFDVEIGTSYDQISVRILSEGTTQEIFTKPTLGAQKTWNHRTYSLDAFAGKTIQVQFHFDTKDTLFNSTEGLYVDEVKVTDPCG